MNDFLTRTFLLLVCDGGKQAAVGEWTRRPCVSSAGLPSSPHSGVRAQEWLVPAAGDSPRSAFPG